MTSLLVAWVCRPMEPPGLSRPMEILMLSSVYLRLATEPSPPRKCSWTVSSSLSNSISIGKFLLVMFSQF